MRRYIAGRLLQSLVVVLLVAAASFFLAHLAPGGPFALDDSRITEAVRAHWRTQFGLDRPLPEQFGRFLLGLFRGELGYSFSRRAPVGNALAAAIPRTLLLMGVALALSIGVGVALGVYQAVRRGRPTERVLNGVSLFFYSLPDFWLALMMLLAFSYWLPVFPAGGIIDASVHEYLGFWGRVWDRLRHLVLPATSLALLTTAAIARYQRAAMLDVVELDFVRTARAKGLPERSVVGRHALRNALLPVITLIGLALPALVGGAVFVETVFSWPGMGRLAAEAIAARDYPLITATVAVGGVTVTLGSLLADVLYALADPRVRVR
ncbi:MAG: ABC transporter permease [Gemmatimonadota bacterium]|nr:ABC transporter permease [Gemmatimonadota bacterium]